MMTNKFFSSKLKNDLHKRWVLQLHKEYENICFQHKIRLKKPLLAVDSLKNTWGVWDAHARLISISEQLILNHNWETVIGILKHEMAHQIVCDIFNSNDAHGDLFLKACKMIAVPSLFCKASVSLEDSLVAGKEENYERDDEAVLRKIEKLLSLAQSANEHEALLAMEKVQEMYEKYHIQKILENEKSEYFSLVFNFKKKKIPATHSLASHILQQHFFVKAIFSELYDSALDETHKIIEVFGTRYNVLMAEYVFLFLIERIELLWKDYQKEHSLGARYKISYQQGVLEGFLKKLDVLKKTRARERPQDCDQNMLIKVDDARLDDFVCQKFPRLSKRGGGTRVYSDHFEKGVQAGGKIHLNRPIQKYSQERKLLPC